MNKNNIKEIDGAFIDFNRVVAISGITPSSQVIRDECIKNTGDEPRADTNPRWGEFSIYLDSGQQITIEGSMRGDDVSEPLGKLHNLAIRYFTQNRN